MRTRRIFYEVFCTSETFTAACTSGHVVVIRRALYGRLSASRCITSEYAHALGCYADVTSHVTDACSGTSWRQNCSLLVATVDAVAQPCGKDFKSYLDIEYDCVIASYTDDCSHGNVSILTESEGYLALFQRPPPSTAALNTDSSASLPHHGDQHVAKSCPWLLVAESGRRFNVSWRLPVSIPSLSTFSSSPAGHSIDEDGVVGFETESHHRTSATDYDENSLPSVTVCSATWKIIDGAGTIAVPGVSQYAACRPSGGGPISARATASLSGGSAGQSLLADRAYYSMSNTVEIHFTGSVEALAAAEQRAIAARRGAGQVRGKAAGHPSSSDGHRGASSGDGNGRQETASLHQQLSLQQPQQHGGVDRRVNAVSGDTHRLSPLAVLHYKVVGCPEVIPPNGTFVSRHLDSAAIICNQSAETWYITCRDGRWSGYIGNCSTPSVEQATLRPTAMSRLQLRFENGVVIAIMVGITLGTIAGAVLLGIVFNINRNNTRKSGLCVSGLRRIKYKDPYASITGDSVKNISATCRHHQHQHGAQLTSSRRFDDVIYPTLLIDDQSTTSNSSSVPMGPMCRDCTCSSAATTSTTTTITSHCAEFSTSGMMLDANDSETMSPIDSTGTPSPTAAHPIHFRPGQRLFPPPPPPATSSRRQQFPLPVVVPPPLFRVFRPSKSDVVTSSACFGHRLGGSGCVTSWRRQVSANGATLEDDSRQAYWRLHQGQAMTSPVGGIGGIEDTQSAASAKFRGRPEDSVSIGRFTLYRSPEQQQQQSDSDGDVSILADARLDSFGRSPEFVEDDVSVECRI